VQGRQEINKSVDIGAMRGPKTSSGFSLVERKSNKFSNMFINKKGAERKRQSQGVEDRIIKS